uniref:MTS domain-containing protein n=1 Tax=Panagrolaimus sp. ES5 TaxID=591445 RepID=A0AC34GIM0_9BILA
MDAFVLEKSFISKLNPSIIVEIGSGSGVVTSFIRTLLSNPSSKISTTSFINFGIDLNPAALKATTETANLNNQSLPELIQCDLLLPFLHRWKSCIDILIFNPPYVPTEEEPTTHLERCYAGGPTGRAAVDRLIPSVSTLLSSSGIFYLVALKSNNIPDIFKFAFKHSLQGSIVTERRCGHEYLYILKFVK